MSNITADGAGPMLHSPKPNLDKGIGLSGLLLFGAGLAIGLLFTR